MAIKGSALLKADGVRADAAAAIAMLQRAADAGNPQAQRELGFAYANAMGGLPLDEAKAIPSSCGELPNPWPLTAPHCSLCRRIPARFASFCFACATCRIRFGAGGAVSAFCGDGRRPSSTASAWVPPYVRHLGAQGR